MAEPPAARPGASAGEVVAGLRKKDPARTRARSRKATNQKQERLFLPRTLFMAICLQALPALVLVHFQTTFLFQVAHVVRISGRGHRAPRLAPCKADFSASPPASRPNWFLPTSHSSVIFTSAGVCRSGGLRQNRQTVLLIARKSNKGSPAEAATSRSLAPPQKPTRGFSGLRHRHGSSQGRKDHLAANLRDRQPGHYRHHPPIEV
jgi:hypothetical protein